MSYPQRESRPARGGSDTEAGGLGYHVQNASAEPLLQRLEHVQRQGNGWRARCPACGGTSRKVSIAEIDGRVLVHCFGGCRGEDVIAAVGLRWADLFPPRHWPLTREERRLQRRAIREAGWAAALSVLPMEAAIVRIAAAHMIRLEPLSWDDYCRLVKAEEAIANAANVLLEGGRYG